MKFIYSVLTFALLVPTASAQVAPKPQDDKDCGCDPVQVDAPKDNKKTTTIQPSQAKMESANDAALKAYHEAHRDTDVQAGWAKMLSAFAARENATLLLDMGTKIQALAPEIPSDRSYGVDGMRALAKVSFTTWRQRDGVQAFAYTRGIPTIGRKRALTTIAEWIKDSDDTTKKQLTQSGLVLSYVPPAVRGAIIESLYDQELSFVFLQRLDKTLVFLKIKPVIAVPASGKRRSFNISLVPFVPPLWNGLFYVPPVDTAKTQKAFEALEPAPKGELNFGTGSIVPLSEITTKATAAFGAPFTSERPPETLFFISGSYTAKSLTAALEATKTDDDFKLDAAPNSNQAAFELGAELLKTHWKDFAATQVDTTWMRGSLPSEIKSDDLEGARAFNKKYGASEGIPASYFIEGKTISAAELSAERIGLRDYFRVNRVADDAQLTLRLDMSIGVATDGKHADGMISATEGKVTQHMQNNDTAFSLLSK